MRLFLTSKIWKEGKWYIAHTPELDVSSQGKTEAQAGARLREAVCAFLETARDRGSLDAALSEAGFAKKKNEWFAPLVTISSLELRV